MQGPCKNCDERFIGCHDSCDAYIYYKQKLLEISERRKADNIDVHNEHRINHLKRINEAKRKK